MSNLSWHSNLDTLFKDKKSKTLEKLKSSGVSTLSDLLWIFPLRVSHLPAVRNFSYAKEGDLFQGDGEIVSFQSRPNFSARGKGKVQLENATAIVKDLNSSGMLQLKWFNNYPSMVKKLRELKRINFWGEVSNFQGQMQIVSPKINEPHINGEFVVTYPTINTISPTHLKSVIDKIPHSLWDEIEENLPEKTILQHNLVSRADCFKKIHGKFATQEEWDKQDLLEAKRRLIYEELFLEQVKIHLRRENLIRPISKKITVADNIFNSFTQIFPYTLTEDQNEVISDIRNDLSTEHPMMRLIQGDVGCGKTSVAVIASLICITNKHQVALMCPTEALAIQHYQTFKNDFSHLGNKAPRISLLLGSTKNKEKKEIKDLLKKGVIDLIIGTHSLIQKDVDFKDLQLAIIDEQHKFGVEQRISLTSKSEGCHCLIMTATPIPRSLSLTQYGDLDISTIKHLPSGRKQTQTRIINPDTFEKFLSFLKTRLSMTEQAYIVVPAINENPDMDLLNLETVLTRFKTFFPEYRINGLHGQMSPEEKSETFKNFGLHKIDILISTSVVEVGINVPNATIMAVMNPERFGLSSLHQLRGRIGRGDKPGFCFLILDKKIGNESLNRLRVIEQTTDGFKIAEEDLKIRGEGNIFGTEQSGSGSLRRIANIVLDQQVLIEAREDLHSLLGQGDPKLSLLIDNLSREEIVYTTV